MSQLAQWTWSLVSAQPKYSCLKSLRKAHPIQKALYKQQHQSPIVFNQHQVTSQRSSIIRSEAPLSQYNPFLRTLYPSAKYVHFQSLYNAYKQLPQPHPLYIQPEHLEHMIAQFMKVSAGEFTGGISKYFTSILEDLKGVGMDVSWREENASNFLFLRGKNIDCITQTYNLVRKTRLQNQGKLDMSTMNMFMRLAASANELPLMHQINSDMTKHRVSPNRITYALLLRFLLHRNDQEGIMKALETIISEGFVIDIVVINDILQSLVANNEVSMAEQIISHLEENSKSENEPFKLDSKHAKRKYITEMNCLDTFHLQNSTQLLFPLTPVYETYLPLISRCLQLNTFQPERLHSLLLHLHQRNIAIPNSVFLNVFNTLKSHKVEDSMFEKLLEIYKLQVSKFVRYDHVMFDSVLSSHLRQNRGKKVERSKDLASKYRQLELISGMKPWTLLEFDPMILDVVDEAIEK